MAGKSAKEQLGVELEEPNRPQEVVQPTPEPAADERPEWLPENFKDPNEFANAYKESQRKITEQAESQKRLEGQITQLTQVVEGLRPEEKPQENPNDYKEQLMAAYESDPIGTIAYLAQQAASQTVDSRLEEVTKKNEPQSRAQQEAQNQLLAMSVDRAMSDRYDDWAEYKDKIGEAIQEDPSLLPEQVLHSPEMVTRSLSRVYENLKAKEILSQAETGNFVTSQMKRQAQTISGAGVRPGTPDASEERIARLQEAAKGMSYSAFRGA